MRPRCLKRNKNIIADRIGRRRGDDPYVGDGCSSQLTADTAKVVPIEKIGFAVLAQSQDQALVAARARSIERKGIAASEVLIVSVEHFPIHGRKVVPLIVGALQVRHKAKNGFAIAPIASAEGIASSKEDVVPDNTQASWRPNAAAPSARLETNHLGWIAQGKADHPAVIIAAITEVAAERDID